MGQDHVIVMRVGQGCCVTTAYQHYGAWPATSRAGQTVLTARAALGPVGTEAVYVTRGGRGRHAQNAAPTTMGRHVRLVHARLVERVEMVWVATVHVYVIRDGLG
jgi:hypothetical protein